MKKLTSIINTSFNTSSRIKESFASPAMVPAQPLAEPLSTVGVTNHYTPIQNIITNVRNLFAPYFGLVVEPGEDGVSIKIHNSGFISQQAVNDILYKKVDRFTSVADYICQQGLCAIKLVNVGKFYVVYFCPTDIKTAEDPNVMNSDLPAEIEVAPCREQLEYNIEEAELSALHDCALHESAWDEEMEDKTKDELIEILDQDDKIKAANAFNDKLGHVITLPEGVYVKAVKDEAGNESIAIRKKFTKRRPFGQSSEVVKSLINIYHTGNDGIWVDPFDNKDAIDEETCNLINSILSWLGAEETGDPCVWKLNLVGSDNSKEDEESNNEEQVHESANESQKYAYLVYDDADCIVGAFPTHEQAQKFAKEFSKENNVDTKVKRIYRSEIENKD